MIHLDKNSKDRCVGDACKKDSTFVDYEKGQTTVEYILLLSIVGLMMASLLKLDIFQRFLGPEGVFAKTFRGQIEYTYRHAKFGNEFSTDTSPQEEHESYKGRFYGAKDKYPTDGN